MHLLPIRENRWGIFAVCKNSGSCQLLDFLGGLANNYSGSVENLQALIVRISDDQRGPNLLPDEISHYVDKKEKIWEFISGDIRLLWFYSNSVRKVIICSHAFIKKSRKTPKSDIAKAIRIKKQYEKAAEQDRIVILKTPKGDA